MLKHAKFAVGALLLALTAAPASAQSWQCAPFARMFSGLQLFGNAYSWWQQATGKYDRGAAPKAGAVMVFKAAGSMRVGHVATVTRVISDRIIEVTHANWSIINGHRGQVERNVRVVDASPNGDWSRVKVWYAPIRDIGIKAYPVYGFIYGGAKAAASGVRAADKALDDAAIAGARGAVAQAQQIASID